MKTRVNLKYFVSYSSPTPLGNNHPKRLDAPPVTHAGMKMPNIVHAMLGYIRAKYGYHSSKGHSHHLHFLESCSLISSKHGVGSLLFQTATAKPIRFLKSVSKLLPCKLH